MTIPIQDERSRKWPSNQVSELLEDGEGESIVHYVGDNARVLASGVCQLVQAENGEWSDPQNGVICLIKDYGTKSYRLVLLDPHPKGYSAKVIWQMLIDSSFTTNKSHSNLVTFEQDVYPYEVCGLNFYEATEAEFFHAKVLEVSLNRRVARDRKTTKRQAPPPPQPAVQPQEFVHQAPVDVSVDVRMNPLHAEPNGTIVGTSSDGVQLPQTTGGKKKEKKEKKKKEGFFHSFFTTKTKKKTTKLDISGPTNFKHIEHRGLDDLPQEHQETLEVLAEHLQIQRGNAEQYEFLRNFVAERGAEIRQSVRAVKKKGAKAVEAMENVAEDSDVETSPSRLHQTRSSIKLTSKNSKRSTPRDIKSASANRKSIDQRDPSPALLPSTHSKSDFDALHPNWDAAAPSVSNPPKPPVDYEDVYEQNNNELAPPLPARLESMGGRRSPVGRRQTGLGPRPEVISAPRLPTRLESRQKSIDRADSPYPAQQHHSPPRIITEFDKSSVPDAPPLPASFLSPSPTPPPSSASPSESCSPVPPPPPPGPPPSDLLRPNHLPPVDNSRRSLLDAIQSADKRTLRHVETGDKSPRNGSPEHTPISGGGLIDSIQKELDKRRRDIDSSSESDSGDTDTDWDE